MLAPGFFKYQVFIHLVKQGTYVAAKPGITFPGLLHLFRYQNHFPVHSFRFIQRQIEYPYLLRYMLRSLYNCLKYGSRKSLMNRIASPVLFISGPSSLLTPGNLLKENTGSLMA